MVNQFLLSLSSVVATWCIVMGFLYVFKEWLYTGFPVMWNRISLWLTVLLLVVAVSVLLIQLVASNWVTVIATVILPRAICALALHMFMVLFRSYMTMRYHQSISSAMFVAVLVAMYLIFIAGTWLTVSAAHPLIHYFTDMIVSFLLQGAVMGMALVSFLLSRIPRQSSSHAPYQSRHDINDDTDRW